MVISMSEKPTYEKLEEKISQLENELSFRKKSKEVHTKNEKWYQYIAENIKDVFWVVAPDWNKVFYISPAYEDVWGRTCESLYQKPLSWFDSVAEEDRQQIRAVIEKKSAGDLSDVKFPEYKIFRPDGSMRWILARAYPLYDEHGNVYLITGIAEDITDRKKVELALEASEKRFKDLVEIIPHGIQEVDEKGIIIFTNPAHQKIHGYSNEELAGKSMLDLSATEKDKKELRKYLQYLVKEKPAPTPWTGIDQTKDGRLINVQVDWDYKFDNEGKVIGFISVITEITEQKQKEKELKESEEKFKAIAETSIDYIYQIDLQGVITYCSPAVEQILGYKPEEIIGRPFADYFHPEELIRINPYFQEVLSGKQAESYKMKVLDKQGNEVLIETSGLPIVRDNEIVGIQGVSRDITEQERTKEALEEEKQNLQETNVALKVLLRESSLTKEELEKSMLANIKNLLLPYVLELESRLSADEKLYTDIIKSNINEITSSFSRKLISIYSKLTPREIQVADFIRQGRTNKEIARLLNITPSAVDFHRRNLRKKFNIKGQKTNLRSHLLLFVG